MSDVVTVFARLVPRARIARVAAVAACALLPACASLAPADDAASTSPPLPLLSPASLGASLQAEQVLHVAYGSDEHSLQCVVRDDAKSLSLICLTGMGQRVFTLDYDGSDLKTWRAPFAPDAIDPQRIVADLQFAYWPLPALKSAWQIGETQVIEPRPGLRRLIHGDRIVAEVHSATADRFPARLWLVNFVYGYPLDIDSQMLAP
ncbi:MAG TPA: DUF3261 domain-containing protein [Solimonas sp.]